MPESQSDESPSAWARYVYGKIARHPGVSVDELVGKCRSTRGAIYGATKQLKDAGWILFVPTLGGYQTMSDYKRSITGDV